MINELAGEKCYRYANACLVFEMRFLQLFLYFLISLQTIKQNLSSSDALYSCVKLMLQTLKLSQVQGIQILSHKVPILKILQVICTF